MEQALRIMNFKDQLFHSSPRISENYILKFIENITFENILFVNKWINREVPPIFYDWFTFSRDLYEKLARLYLTIIVCINIPNLRTQKYSRFSIRASTICSWNSMQNLLIKYLSLKSSTSKNIKYFLTKHFIEKY